MEPDKSKPSGFLFEAIARDVNVAEFAVFREYLRQITRGCTISEVVDFQTGHSLNLRWPSAAIEAHDDTNLASYRICGQSVQGILYRRSLGRDYPALQCHRSLQVRHLDMSWALSDSVTFCDLISHHHILLN